MNIINECLDKAAGFFRDMNNEVREGYEILGNLTHYPHLDKLADLIMLGDKESERLCEEYGVTGFLLRTQLTTTYMERNGDHWQTCSRISNAKQYRDEDLAGFVIGASHEGRPIIHFLRREFTPFNVDPTAILGLDVIIGPGTNIGKGAKIASGVKIGAGCDIEKNADLRTGTIIGNFTRVQENATIEESEVGAYSYINKEAFIFNASIGFCASIASNASIGSRRYEAPDQANWRVHIGEHFGVGERVQIGKGCEIGNDVFIQANVSVQAFTVIRDNVQIAEGNYELPRGTYELNKFVIFVRPRFTYEFENFAVGNSHFPEIAGGIPVRHRAMPTSYNGGKDGTMYASVIALWNEETKAVDFIHTGRDYTTHWGEREAADCLEQGKPVPFKGIFSGSRIFTQESATEVIKTFFGTAMPLMEAFLIGMNRDYNIAAPAIKSPAYLAVPESERILANPDAFDFVAEQEPPKAKRRIGKK